MSIADKIAKIIAKADSSTHPEEAEAFMAKAHAMMEQHGLSLLDLGRLDSDDPVGKDLNAYHNNNVDHWRYQVGGALANYYGCRIIGEKTFTDRGQARGRYWHVFGRESARITFTVMWPFVDRQVMAMAREAHKAGVYSSIPKARTAIGKALAIRLYDMVEVQEERRENDTGLNALVPVDIIQAEIDATFSNVKKGRALTYNPNDDYANSAAAKVQVNRQATGAGVKRLGAN
jgi:hypothetical protein